MLQGRTTVGRGPQEGEGMRTVATASTVEQLASLVIELLGTLDEAGNIRVPDVDAAADWVREVFTDVRGPLRMRRSLRQPSAEASALKSMIDWHRGVSGGSLWGPMMHRMSLGERRFDEVDTVAHVVIVAGTGRLPRSVGAERWAEVLGMSV